MFCTVTKPNFSLQPSCKDFKMWLHHEFESHTTCQRQWQISLSKKKQQNKTNTETQKVFIKRCSCPKFPWNNDDASPEEGGFWREKNKRETHSEPKHRVFPIVLHETDGSGGNWTSLNYKLESNKLWLLRRANNWEWSGKRNFVFHISQRNPRLTCNI